MRGKHPQAFMEELGFGPLDLVDSFSVSMAGRHHCAALSRAAPLMISMSRQ